MRTEINKKITSNILILNFFILLNQYAFALPDSPIEQIENKNNENLLIVGGNLERDKCFDYLGEAEIELGKFKNITNFLGCNSIPVPLSYCKCLNNLSGSSPSLVRDIPKEVIGILTSHNIENLNLLKKVKSDFVSSFDGLEKKKKSLEFDQIYCEALKKFEDERNKNDLLAKSIIKNIDDLEKKVIGFELLVDKSFKKIRQKKEELKKVKGELKANRITLEQYKVKEQEFILFKNKVEKEIEEIKKESSGYKEKLIFNFHMLKITKPLSLSLIKNKIEKELKDVTVPLSKKNSLYEMIYLLGKKGDDESVKYLGELISRNDLKIEPDHPVYNSIIKALGFSRNPKGFDVLYDKLKNDKKVRAYQKNFYFYKSLGLMMEKSPELIERKLKDFSGLSPKDKKELLLTFTNVKNEKVSEFLRKVIKRDDSGELNEELKEVLSDIKMKEERDRVSVYLEDQIQIGILRNTKANLDSFLYEKIIDSNMASMKTDYSKIQFSERLLDLERYDLIVKMIGKNQEKLLEKDNYINGLFHGLIRKVSSDSQNLKMRDLQKTSEALRQLGKSDNPKVKSMVKEALLKIGDPKEIKRVLNDSLDEKSRENSLGDLQNIRAKDRFTQQNVIKHYDKAVKELTKPKKNETGSEKELRIKKVEALEKSSFGKIINFQKEAIINSKNTEIGKKLSSMDYGKERDGDNYLDFYGRPQSLTRPIIGKTKIVPPEEESDLDKGAASSTNPFSNIFRKAKKNSLENEKLTGEESRLAQKYIKKVFKRESKKIPRSLLLPEKNFRPLSSLKNQDNIQKELRKLEQDINHKENILAESFGSSRGDDFWKDNDLRSRLDDSRKEAFRKLKKESSSKRKNTPVNNNTGGKKVSKSSSPFIDGAPPSAFIPTEVIEKSSLKNLKTSNADPISNTSGRIEGYRLSSVQNVSDLLNELQADISISYEPKKNKESNVLKEEEFKILLISKEGKSKKLKKEKTIPVKEEFLSLEENERNKVLTILFKGGQKRQLVLRTPKGILIRVERKIKILKKPLLVKNHEERLMIEEKLESKEKRRDDLYNKLRNFLKKSKNN
ncbi:MAG: hypothetical protein CME68_09845 [Halobacteriovoraceae bacterium]|nr:hypothetical protein [Halobacteriovoraceae bacterium]